MCLTPAASAATMPLMVQCLTMAAATTLSLISMTVRAAHMLAPYNPTSTLSDCLLNDPMLNACFPTHSALSDCPPHHSFCLKRSSSPHSFHLKQLSSPLLTLCLACSYSSEVLKQSCHACMVSLTLALHLTPSCSIVPRPIYPIL
jgi:hypothetical protein